MRAFAALSPSARLDVDESAVDAELKQILASPRTGESPHLVSEELPSIPVCIILFQAISSFVFSLLSHQVGKESLPNAEKGVVSSVSPLVLTLVSRFLCC